MDTEALCRPEKSNLEKVGVNLMLQEKGPLESLKKHWKYKLRKFGKEVKPKTTKIISAFFRSLKRRRKMKEGCQYLFKEKVLKNIFETDVNGEIIMAHNTQLILQSVVSQELLGGKLLRLTNKEHFTWKNVIRKGKGDLNVKRNRERFTRPKCAKKNLITWYFGETVEVFTM